MTDYSQNGESKVLKELFDKMGINRGSYIDIGAGDGYKLSNTAYFRQSGWVGSEYDADPRGSKFVKEMKVTVENVNTICNHCNLLSIDIDGNDYWVLREVLKNIHPDVIIFEVNSQLPLHKQIAMPYNADHEWDGTNYFGMSYLAGFKICEDFSYQVYCIVNRSNIIAISKSYDIQPLSIKIQKT